MAKDCSGVVADLFIIKTSNGLYPLLFTPLSKCGHSQSITDSQLATYSIEKLLHIKKSIKDNIRVVEGLSGPHRPGLRVCTFSELI